MASDKDMMCAATFLWHKQELRKAGTLIQKMIDNQSNASIQATAIKGWIYLSSQKEEL
jgi:hypothetical protein